MFRKLKFLTLLLCLLAGFNAKAQTTQYSITQGGNTYNYTFNHWDDLLTQVETFTGTAESPVVVNISGITFDAAEYSYMTTASYSQTLVSYDDNVQYTTFAFSDCQFDACDDYYSVAFTHTLGCGTKLEFNECTFDQRLYGVDGGTAQTLYSIDVTFNNCTFKSAATGGVEFGDLSFDGCEFQGLVTWDQTEAIVNATCGNPAIGNGDLPYKNSVGENSTLTIKDCTFADAITNASWLRFIYGCKFYSYIIDLEDSGLEFYPCFANDYFIDLTRYQSGNYTSGTAVSSTTEDNPQTSAQFIFLAFTPTHIIYNGNAPAGATVTGSTVDNADYQAGGSFTAKANGFTCIGYSFTGWNTKADDTGTALQPGNVGTVNWDPANNVLYAQWEETGPFRVVRSGVAIKDYPTLQQAVDAAQSGDEIQVLPCADFGVTEYDYTYSTNVASDLDATKQKGRVYIENKSITLQNHGNRESAVLDGFEIVLAGITTTPDITFSTLSFTGASLIVPITYSNWSLSSLTIDDVYADVRQGYLNASDGTYVIYNKNGISITIGTSNYANNAFVQGNQRNGNGTIDNFTVTKSELSVYHFVIGGTGEYGRILNGDFKCRNITITDCTLGKNEEYKRIQGYSFVAERMGNGEAKLEFSGNTVYAIDNFSPIVYLNAASTTPTVDVAMHDNNIYTPSGQRIINDSGRLRNLGQIYNQIKDGKVTTYRNYVNGYCHNEFNVTAPVVLNKQHGHTDGDGHIKECGYGLLKADDIYQGGWADNFTGGEHHDYELGTTHYCDRCDELEMAWPGYVNGVNAVATEDDYKTVDGNVEIYTENGFAWLVNVVNGKNGATQNSFSGKTVTLKNDLDMTDYRWMSIGTYTTQFQGTFNGNGYTITGLWNDDRLGEPGMFGHVGENGVVKNVFVTSCDFVNRTSQTGGHIGIVADTITNGAIVESCEVMGKISTASSSIIAGGLVGLVDAGSELHSSMSLAEVCGSHIGGLVGETRGSTNNCISYPDFYCTELGTGSNYAAGLVGISSGSVENNYVRFNTHSNWYVPSLGQLRMLFGMETIFLTSVSSWKSMTVHDDALYLTSSLHDANHVYVIDCRLPSTNGGAGNIGSDDINNLHYVRLVGNYVGSGHHEGDIINVDGRLGIVFHVNDDDTGGWVAALSDLDINGTTKFKFCTSSAAASMSDYYNTDDHGDPVYIDNIEHDYAFGNNGKLFCETLSNAESASSDNVIGKMKAENWPIMQFEYANGSILRECYHLLPTSEYALVNSGSTTDCGQYTTTTVPYAYAEIGCMVGSNRMMDLMNAWVDAKNALKYAAWAQPITKGINTDYPVLKFKDFNTMANDGATPYLYYGDLDAQLATYTTSGQTVFFYGSKESSSANNLSSAASLYVDQDAALASGANLKGYTSRLLDNPSERWHLYASPLQDSKIGFIYGTADKVKWNEETNPCGIVLDDNPQSIFPTGTPIESMDLYCFYEKEYHWLNLKRNRLSHWHMNKHDANIAYSENDNLDNDAATNNSVLVQGKGYLTSIEAKSYLQSNGQFSDGTVTMPVTVLAGTMNAGQGIQANEGTELKGYNLLGNPYQSYLSFARFAEVNGTLWAESTTPSYAVFDAESGSYIPGTAAEISKGSFAAQGDINMHQGFFIVADNAGTATFDNTMRSVVPLCGTHFRGEELAYPLVNLVVTDATGTGDVAVVEFDRPEYKAAAKMKHIGADGKIYFHHNGGDQALLFLDEPTDHLPVHFEAIADGSYTMTWSTANADFSYLHLIDNVAGMDIDMLTSESYTFTATTDDYKSRFKLMFAYTGIDENEDTELAEVFAFVHDGNLIVNGEGMLEVIDMCGRCIVNTELTDAQNTVSLPQTASGLYVLRLINDNKSKVQKIVVR